MTRLVLQRGRSTDQGTPGVLLRPDGSRLCHALELPWRENRPQVSSIPPGYMPAGEYVCVPHRSPRFGSVYRVTGVPGRSAVLAHTGNVAGDVSRGFVTHSHGCVLLGLYRGSIDGQLAVVVSRPAVTRLVREMDGQPFVLRVTPWAS